MVVVGVFDKSNFSGKEGIEVRLEYDKEWIWGENVEILNRVSFLKKLGCKREERIEI